MTALPHIQYFLGANSPTGFYSLYDHLIPPEQARAVFILKGGPGCGKSTLMRRIGAWAEEAGLETEYILCSGDPDSLDALILPGRATAIVDGTAPQGVVTLGHFCFAHFGFTKIQSSVSRFAADSSFAKGAFFRSLELPENLGLLPACGRVLFSDFNSVNQSDYQFPRDSFQL